MSDSERMEVEWIILADSAEVVINKVYLMGGGWETLTMNVPLPAVHPCAVAASFLVPPSDEPGRALNIGVQIVDTQNDKVLVDVGGQIEAAWSPGRPPTGISRVPVAVKFGLAIDHPGRYAVKAHIEDAERQIQFAVIEGEGAIASRSTPVRRKPRRKR
jgi:hypothetical protein